MSLEHTTMSPPCAEGDADQAGPATTSSGGRACRQAIQAADAGQRFDDVQGAVAARTRCLRPAEPGRRTTPSPSRVMR